MKTRCRFLFILTVLIVSVSAVIYISAAAEGGIKMNFKHILNIQIPGVTLKSTEFSDSNFLADVPYAVSSVEVTVTAAEGSSVKINNDSVKSGAASSPIALGVGNTFITIEVTAADGTVESAVITIKRAQDPEILYKETYRPQFHHTPPIFLQNDPNGLVYNAATGEYHLYYQYAANLIPDQETKVWGHAVSKDLVYWEEMPIAIYPDEWGEAYSGSAVIDYNNTSGLFDDSTPPEARMVLFYTSYSGKFGDSSYGDQNQSMAYSKDNGVTWIKYEGNPVIKNERNRYSGGFRDPKVIWYEDDSFENGGIWLMVVGGGPARLFTSPDLINWTYNTTLKNGRAPIDAECPDFFPLAVNGDENNVKWVYMGALYNDGNSRTIYAIGELVKDAEGKFEFNCEYAQLEKPINGCCAVYAQQTFFNDAKGRRIAVSWIRDWNTFNDYETGNIKNWLGTHTLPVELKLIYDDGEYEIKQIPVEELNKLRYPDSMFQINDIKVSDGDSDLLAGMEGELFEIEATFTLGSAAGFGFRVRTGTDEETVIHYNVTDKKLLLDRTQSGIAISEGGEIISVDMKPCDGKVTLRIFVDTSIIDIYGNNGDAVINTQIYPSDGSNGMAFYVQNGDVTVDSMTVYKLDSIHFSGLKQGGNHPQDGTKSNINSILTVVIIVLAVCVLAFLAGMIVMRARRSSGSSANTSIDEAASGSALSAIVPLPESKQGKSYWEGKRIAFLGDSITEMNGYQSLVRRYLNTSRGYTYAVGGTQLTGLDRSFTQRAEDIKEDVDLIFVFGGTNDFHVGAPIGSVDDEASTETFCGSVRKVCEILTAQHPDSLIVFATPLQRTNPPGTGVHDKNALGLGLAAYVQAIIDVCADFQIPVLDFYNTSAITEKTADQYLFDGLHPNQDGFQVIARELAAFLCPGEDFSE